jgi:hypothetical protein
MQEYTTKDLASVNIFEIEGPPCPDCFMSITHSGSLYFYEERDRTASGFPNDKPVKLLDDCDWT